MTGSEGGSPFQDDGSGSRNTLIVLAAVVVLVIAAAAAAIVVVLRQKHSDTSGSAPSATTSTTTTTTTTTTQPATPAGRAGVNVIVDGVAHSINGQVACIAAAGNINIGVGDPSGSSLGAILSDSDPPEVQTVGLIIGGNPVSYTKGGRGDASATKDGNTYKITGHGFGVPDLPDPTPPLKSFEVDVTCP